MNENNPDCIKSPKLQNTEKELKYYGFELSGRNKEVIPGNPRVGKITVIKQIHRVLGSEHLMSKEYRRALIAYQREIYQELKRNNARDVFAEGFLPKDVEAIREEYETIRKSMRKRENLEEMLIDLGGAALYVAEDPKNRILHATERQEIRWRSMDYEFRHGCLSADIQQERESHVIALVQEFLDKHPGKHAYIVFGAAHTFQDNIESTYAGRKPPYQENIGFTNLARRLFDVSRKEGEAKHRRPTPPKYDSSFGGDGDSGVPFGFPPSHSK